MSRESKVFLVLTGLLALSVLLDPLARQGRKVSRVRPVRPVLKAHPGASARPGPRAIPDHLAARVRRDHRDQLAHLEARAQRAR